MTPELDSLLALHVDDDIGRRPLDELRDLCRRSQEWETAVSLIRRLAQGRLDMLRYEAQRRAGEHAGDADAPGLLFDLPDILAESHGGSTGRAIALQPQWHRAEALTEVLDRVADPALLCRPSELADERLADLVAELSGFEHQLSGLRHALHDQLDALHAEIGRRYRDGEATVESLLG